MKFKNCIEILVNDLCTEISFQKAVASHELNQLKIVLSALAFNE